MHDSSVLVDVTMAVSPAVFVLQAGNPAGLVVSIFTSYTPATGAGIEDEDEGCCPQPLPTNTVHPEANLTQLEIFIAGILRGSRDRGERLTQARNLRR